MKKYLRDWAVPALPIILLTYSASLKLVNSREVIEQMTGHFGYPPSTIMPIGLLEFACMLLYAIPKTSVLGAILVTAYLGGATATHVRASDPYFMPPLVGVLVWLGLYLRDERIRALVPLLSAKR
jgi:hypothetical protein